MGAVQLFCALLVASGVPLARTRSGKTFADFRAFLLELFQSALCAGLKVVHLILDNGSTHAPKQLGPWIASLELALSGFTGCRRTPVGSIRSRSSSARCNVTCSPRTIFRVRWHWRSSSRPILMSSIGIRNPFSGPIRKPNCSPSLGHHSQWNSLRNSRGQYLEVLREIKTSNNLRTIPVVVLTTSTAKRDVVSAYAQHANSYLVKPVDFATFTRLMHDLGLYWLLWYHHPLS